MSAIVLLLALAIIGVCIYGIASPTGYVDLARNVLTRMGVWGAAMLRLVLAVALWLSADESATPLAFKVLALVSLLGGLSVPFVGLDKIERMIQWISKQSPWFLRSTCGLGVALGTFLGWSILTASNVVQ